MMQILQVCISHMRKLQHYSALFFFFKHKQQVAQLTKAFKEQKHNLKGILTNPEVVNSEQTFPEISSNS